MSSPGGGTQLHLNFQNHCLLCLQYVDPEVIKDLWEENPKGLLNFQPVLHYLTGTVDIEGGAGKIRQYPVTKNLPPLCTICYDILAEVNIFHLELMELQRKIQNQTEAARRIAKGTTRKNGGMKAEFLNRLRIAGLSQKEMSAMEYFLSNFHGLVTEADRKAVLPQLFSLTFNGGKITSPSPISSPTKSALQPYSVEFAAPSLPSPKKSTPASASGPVALYTINNMSAAPTTWLITNNTAMLVQKLPDSASRPSTKTAQLNPSSLLSLQDAESTPENSRKHPDDVIVLHEPNPAAFEFEGDDEYDCGGGMEEMMSGAEDDSQIMLEEKTELHLEHDEEGVDDGNTLVLDNTSKEDLDVNYWKSVLSSQIIMEDVQKEDPDAPKETPEDPQDVELIHLDDDDEEDQGTSSSTFSTRNGGTGRAVTSTKPSIVLRQGSALLNGQPVILTFQDPSTITSPTVPPLPPPATPETDSRKQGFAYHCSVCGKGYQSSHRLKYHEMEHQPGGRPKPFQCRHCDKMFSSKKLMEQHALTHTGERPYKCSVCGDRFRQTSTLYRHKQIHKK